MGKVSDVKDYSCPKDCKRKTKQNCYLKYKIRKKNQLKTICSVNGKDVVYIHGEEGNAGKNKRGERIIV